MRGTAAPAWLAALLVLLLHQFAWAASLRTEVSARKVGVGQRFTVQLTAVQGEKDAEPQNPQLTIQGAADVQGPSVSSQRRVMMRNFNFDSESSVVASWTVVALKKGKLVIGPGTFQVGGQTLRGETVVVDVVDAPQGPQARGGRRSPFGLRGQDPFDDFPRDLFSQRRFQRPSIPEAPEEYQLDQAPDPTAFLRARLSKSQVVLGEPVRLTILAYGARGNFREVSPGSPSLSDFLSYSVVESSHDEPPYRTTIDGEVFLVRKLREYVLIPLKTGTLEVGEMTAVLTGARGSYPSLGSPHGMKVQSPVRTLKVISTPEREKPEGYFPGDVGRYRLSAQVSPGVVASGEFLEVTLQITGRGQVPSQVLLPEAKGVVWEQPTSRGGPEIKDGELQGTRTLKYAVQLTGEGNRDLGEVSLPFYDHISRRYKIARASLGQVQIEKGKTAQPPSTAPAADETDNSFVELALQPKAVPSEAPSSQAKSPPHRFWLLIWGLPVLVWLLGPLMRVLRRTGGALRKSDELDPQRLLKTAEAHLKEDETNEAQKLLERAVHEAIARSTGLRSRGILLAELKKELGVSGLSEELSQEIFEILSASEAARYGAAEATTRDLVGRGRKLCSQLSKKHTPKKASEKSESQS